MKKYKSYMDNITVDSVLHDKIMSRLTQEPKPFPRGNTVYRYAAGAICVIALAVYVWMASEPNGLPTIPSITDQPLTTPPTSTENIEEMYPLLFYQAEQKLNAKRAYLPGYFTQQLSKDDFQNLFGNGLAAICENHMVSGTAGFLGTGDLMDVSILCTNITSGIETVIQMGNGPVWVDYLVPDTSKSADVGGVPVISGFWEGNDFTEYFSSFELEQTGYFLTIHGDDSAKDELTELVNFIISGGSGKLNEITPDYIPEWRDDKLTLKEAKTDKTFGAYVPSVIPKGFTFESSNRLLNQESNILSLYFSDGNMGYLNIMIREPRPDDAERIADPAKTETYDLSLYPIPRAESVPSELWMIVNNPVFNEADLSPEIVNARAYTVNDAGDTPGYRMQFSILYGDVIIEISSKGAQPNDIYEMLTNNSL